MANGHTPGRETVFSCVRGKGVGCKHICRKRLAGQFRNDFAGRQIVAVSVVYGCGPNLTRPGSGWHTIPLLLWGRNFRSGPAGWSWLRALQGRQQDDTWAAALEARLRPERPCLRGSHAWSSAGGLSSEPFADPRDVASSSILGIFQLLPKHVL